MILFCILFSIGAYGQNAGAKASDKIEPRWIKNPPRSSNSDVPFVVVPVYTDKLSSATDLSFHELSKNLPRSWYVDTDVKTVDSTAVINRIGQEEDRTFIQTVTLTDRTKGAEIKLNCQRIAEYWKKDKDGLYNVCYLYQVAAPGKNGPFDMTTRTDRYGTNGLWRSIIVPGWGQMHKGSYGKGGLILGGTAVLAGSIVATESIRSNYAKKINMTHNVEEKKLFAKRTNQFSTARNICCGALGALYVYNLIDAIVAPGAERVIVTKRGQTIYMDYSSTSISFKF